jgi:coenzyme F420-reducing hydrogenase delta subunit
MSHKAAGIIVFACNWDGLSCIEAAGRDRLGYSSSVKVVRVSCLSRVRSGLILKAFELGADGVMLLGCQPDTCSYDKDDGCVAEEYEKARGVLGLLGLGSNRLKLARLPRGDGYGFVKQVTNFVEEIARAE